MTRSRAAAKIAPVSDPMCESMPGRMGPVRAPSTAKRRTNGVDRRRRDVLTLSVAHAHNDAARGLTDTEVARRYSEAVRPIKARTVNDWHRIGPPEARAFAAYLLACSDPYRLEAHVKALVKGIAIRKLNREQLIDRFHELRAREKELEGADNGNDVRRGMCWLERAAQKERDAAVEEELAAVMREFAARGLTESEVMDRRAH